MKHDNERPTTMDIEKILELLKHEVREYMVPSVTHLSSHQRGAFVILVSTVLSSRTKDETTLAATERLFSRIAGPSDLLELTQSEIRKLIYPVGFYKTKARTLKKLAKVVLDDFKGAVPSTMDELLTIPGVGRKTANLVLGLGFNIPAICVDTHVHRITNRWGFVTTETPEQTEMVLRQILPAHWWISINTILVSFGQNICKPLSPLCSTCPLSDACPRRNVGKSR